MLDVKRTHDSLTTIYNIPRKNAHSAHWFILKAEEYQEQNKDHRTAIVTVTVTLLYSKLAFHVYVFSVVFRNCLFTPEH